MTRRMVQLLCCVALLAGRAAALERDESKSLDARAAALRAEADTRFAGGDYEGALRVLRHGYALTRDLRFLFNLGVTYHSLGECELARDHYQRYLQEEPAGPFHEEAGAALVALHPVCGREPARSEQRAPPLAPSALPRQERSEAAPSPVRSTRVWKYALFSVGGAGLVATGFAASLWSRAHSDYAALIGEASREGRAWDECCARRGEQLEARQARYRIWTAGVGIGSLLALGSATVLLLSESREQLSLTLGAGGFAGMSFQNAF
jgi:tetratricopeptide (TPR) repeat protein